MFVGRSNVRQLIADRNGRKFGLLSNGVNSFVVAVRFNFEFIDFNNAIFIGETIIGRITGLGPDTERMFVVRIVGVLQPLKTVTYAHLCTCCRLVSVLVNQRYLEFRNEKVCTEDYRDAFVTTFAHAGFFWVYAAIGLSRLAGDHRGK